MMNPLAKTLKAKMIEKNISANALEKKAGLKLSVVQNILQGKSKNPTLHTLQAICQILECSLEELTTDASKPWNASLYEEAVKVANTLFTERNFQPSKEKATYFIDEVYKYAITSENQTIDTHFAKWLFNKQFPSV